MIIPKRDAKYYGAVHIDNYLTFTGFCKKVDSNEICDVDVFVDGKKIDTLKADKKIAKVEDIYDIEGHGFAFELEEKYFEKSHLLEFKASSGEELVNSKIQTIDKNHVKFNEYRFLNSLSNVDVEKIKDLYCKDAIGFLAIEENLNDKDFMEYIRELTVKFPDLQVKGVYFDKCKVSYDDKIKYIKISSINELLLEIGIYIQNGKHMLDGVILNKLIGILPYQCYIKEDFKLKLNEIELKYSSHFLSTFNININEKSFFEEFFHTFFVKETLDIKNIDRKLFSFIYIENVMTDSRIRMDILKKQV